MFKSEAEDIIKRANEEFQAKFSEEQVKCLAMAMMKINGRMIEESFASYRPGGSGKPSFFTD